MAYKKILSIDGGGIKGIFTAKFLAEIEDTLLTPLNKKICDYFDIIAGTSTGAIIASALALGIPAKKVLDLYLENASVIFKGYSQNFIFGSILYIKGLLGYRYSNKNLKKVLQDVFKEAKIGNCKTRLLIPAFNVKRDDVEVFKTSHHTDFRIDYKEKIVDVLLATTAAPTYFPVYEFGERGKYIDGGIGANNPGLIAVIEAITRCGWDRSKLKLLSFGAPAELNTGKRKFKNIDTINAFMRAESLYSQYIAGFLIGNNDNYKRIAPVVESEQVGLDNITKEAINTLLVLARAEAQRNFAYINSNFLDIEKDEFIPCHKLQ